VSWLSIGVIFGLISTVVKLKPKERLRFHSRQLPSRLISCLPSALLVAATFGIGFLILLGLADSSTVYIRNAIGSIPDGVASLLFGGLAGLGYVLIQLLSYESPKTASLSIRVHEVHFQQRFG
jgi:hypothetical protein